MPLDIHARMSPRTKDIGPHACRSLYQATRRTSVASKEGPRAAVLPGYPRSPQDLRLRSPPQLPTLPAVKTPSLRTCQESRGHESGPLQQDNVPLG